MTQRRIQDFGSPVVASSLKELAISFGQAAILNGNNFVADAADRVRINPGSAITDQGVIIIEDESKTLTIVNTSVPADYTVFYAHEDQDISGGLPAILTLDSGLLTPSVVSGVILGYIRYPGGAVPLSGTHFIQAPPLKIGTIIPTNNNINWLVPVNNQGYMTTATSGAVLNITNVYDISGTKPEMFIRIRNNDTVNGQVVLTFPFKVGPLPFALLQIILATDINALVTPSFVDSVGTVTALTTSPFSGEPNLLLKQVVIARDTIQTPNTLVYLQIDFTLAATREVKLQALGLNPFNLPV